MSFKTGASTAALALTLSLTAAAAQQQVSPPTVRPETARVPVAGQIVTQPAESIMARDLIGQTVNAPDNTKIGSISDLIMSKDGRTVEGFVIGVGGFLGMGKHDILVQLDKLKFVDEPVKTSSATPTSPTGTTGSAARPAPSPSTSASTPSTKNKWYPDHAVMSGATKESLKNMAAFKFD